MQTRKVVANVVGLAACVAVGYGIHEIMLIGTCGGRSGRPCPEGTGPVILLMVGGILVATGAMIAGGLLAFPGLFLAIGVGSIVVGLQAPDGTGSSFPLIFGGFFALGGLVPLAFVPMRARTRQRAETLLATGIPAIGTILAVRDTGVTINDNPRVALTVRIEPRDGTAPFDGDKTVTMSRVQPLMVGQRYPVLLYPGDRSKFGIVTEITDPRSVPPKIRELWQLARGGGSYSTPTYPAPAAQPGGDPLDRLAKLNELRQAGALTEQEFAAAKARILGNP